MRREETIDFNIRAAWHSIARMYNQQAARYGGTMSIGFALLTISAEEGTPATKIGPLMGLETKSLTRLIKSMEEKGLICRVTDTHDKRSVRIVLTEEGKKQREKARATVLRFNEAVRSEIPARKLDTFFEVITQVNQLLDKNEIFERSTV